MCVLLTHVWKPAKLSYAPPAVLSQVCYLSCIEQRYEISVVPRRTIRIEHIKLSYAAQLVHSHRDLHTSVREFASTSSIRKSDLIRRCCVRFAHILKCSIAAIFYCRLS